MCFRAIFLKSHLIVTSQNTIEYTKPVIPA